MRLLPTPAGAALCLALFSAAAPEAQMPRVSAFLHHDSLAVAVVCEPLLTGERRERLHGGYPLSFVLELKLLRHDPIWPDAELFSRRAGFRITHEKWDARYTCALHDFTGQVTRLELPRLEDIVLAIEDRLSATLTPAAGLDAQARYYFTIAVEYRNLTFEDVRSTEEWLRGAAARDSVATATGAGRSADGGVLGFLWDLAGLKGERREAATPKFRPGQLRTLDDRLDE